jgi:hypothetical protein
MGPDRHHPRKLALACRPSRLSGLDRPPPQDRPNKRLKLGGNITFPSAHAAPLANGVARDLFAGHANQQKTSFHTLGTRLGPVISLARRRFFVRLKGPFLRPGEPHAKRRAERWYNDRTSDRDTAPTASLTVASTVLLKIGPLEASGKRPQPCEVSARCQLSWAKRTFYAH